MDSCIHMLKKCILGTFANLSEEALQLNKIAWVLSCLTGSLSREHSQIFASNWETYQWGIWYTEGGNKDWNRIDDNRRLIVFIILLRQCHSCCNFILYSIFAMHFFLCISPFRLSNGQNKFHLALFESYIFYWFFPDS